MKNKIHIQTTIQAPVEKAWESYTTPKHIEQWNQASDDWHTPHAENDLRVGGKFLSRMEAKDGSMGFDFEGVYDAVEIHKHIAYSMPDGRQVEIHFNPKGSTTEILIDFDPENENSLEMQRAGWQAILDNFKKYTEKL